MHIHGNRTPAIQKKPNEADDSELFIVQDSRDKEMFAVQRSPTHNTPQPLQKITGHE